MKLTEFEDFLLKTNEYLMDKIRECKQTEKWYELYESEKNKRIELEKRVTELETELKFYKPNAKEEVCKLNVKKEEF